MFASYQLSRELAEPDLCWDLGMAEQAAKKVASPLYLGFDFSTQQVESKLSVSALYTKLTVKYADGLGTIRWGSLAEPDSHFSRESLVPRD